MSTDGGSVWTQKDSYYSDGYDLVHGGGDTFWCCGSKYSSPNYSGVISQTDNSGNSWTRHTLFTGTSYGYIRTLAVDPSNQDRVYGLGYYNSVYTLFYTHDGGATWDQVTASGYTGTPYAMVVRPGHQNHLAAASSNGLYQSTDGGVSWTKVTASFSGAYDIIESFYVGGVMIATSDGVWHWNWSGSPIEDGTGLGTPRVNCLEEGEYAWCYAGTNGGAVWKKYNGLPVEGEGSAPLDHRTLRVFPNPAEPGTASVAFSLASGGPVVLTVYDLSGRVVREYMETSMEAGENLLELETSELIPGIYLIRLDSEGFQPTARLVITQ